MNKFIIIFRLKTGGNLVYRVTAEDSRMAVETSLNDITDIQMNALENIQVINEIEFKEVMALKKIENHNTQNHPILIGYCDSDKSGTKLKSIEDVAKYIIEKGVSEDVRITHQDGTPFLDTFGVFINRISDMNYRENLLKVLIPMQQKLSGCTHSIDCSDEDISISM